MDLTAQPLLTFRPGVSATVAEVIHLPASLFCRRDARPQFRIRTKTGIAHAQWREDVSPREFVQHHSAHAMHDFTKRDVVDVAVDETRARSIAQRLAIQTFDR